MLKGLYTKEKGQMSIEVLIIMAVLTIGALVAGTYYISTITTNIKKAKSTDFDGSRAFEKTNINCTTSQLNSISFSPTGGTYSTSQLISLNYTGSCSDVKMHYTTNGNNPTCTSSLYTTPIEITSTTTIKVIACVNSIYGNIQERIYTISE